MGLIPSLAYALVVDWRLTWAPVRAGAPIDYPSMRAGTITRRVRYDVGMNEGIWLGIGTEGEGDRLIQSDGWLAQIMIGTDAAGSFTVEPVLSLGGAERRDSLTLTPGTRAPFMISVPGRRPEWEGTILILDGVAVTGARIALVPFFRELIRRIFG